MKSRQVCSKRREVGRTTDENRDGKFTNDQHFARDGVQNQRPSGRLRTSPIDGTPNTLSALSPCPEHMYAAELARKNGISLSAAPLSPASWDRFATKVHFGSSVRQQPACSATGATYLRLSGPQAVRKQILAAKAEFAQLQAPGSLRENSGSCQHSMESDFSSMATRAMASVANGTTKRVGHALECGVGRLDLTKE